jgi:hypothetical protein
MKPVAAFGEDLSAAGADLLSQLTQRAWVGVSLGSMPPCGICHFASPAGIRMR